MGNIRITGGAVLNTIVKLIKDWVIPILIALAITFLVNKFIFFNIQVPSESMYPTIKIGDRIMVLRIPRTNSLKRGDIVVFNSKELKEVLVKRLMGLPGDEITIDENGNVAINGRLVEEPYVLKKDGSVAKTFKVPEGSFFFMGDNRPVSWDSRKWEQPYIPKEAIMGKAFFRIYPFNRFGKL